MQQRLEVEQQLAEVARQRAEQEAQILQHREAQQASELTLFEQSREHAAAQKNASEAIAAKQRDMAELNRLETERAALEEKALALVQDKLLAEKAAYEFAAQRLTAEQDLARQSVLRAQAEQSLCETAQARAEAESEAASLAHQKLALEAEFLARIKMKNEELANLQHTELERLDIEQQLFMQMQLQADVEKQTIAAHQAAMEEVSKKIEAERLILVEAEKRALAEKNEREVSEQRATMESALSEATQHKLETERQALEATAARLANERNLQAELALVREEEERARAISMQSLAQQQHIRESISTQQKIDLALQEQLRLQALEEEKRTSLLQAKLEAEQAILLLAQKGREQEEVHLQQTQVQKQLQLKAHSQLEIKLALANEKLVEQRAEADVLAQNLIEKLKGQCAQQEQWCLEAKSILAAASNVHQFPSSLHGQPKFKRKAAIAAVSLVCAGLAAVSGWSALNFASAPAFAIAPTSTSTTKSPAGKASTIVAADVAKLKMTEVLSMASSTALSSANLPLNTQVAAK